MIAGSINPVGRITCSITAPLLSRISIRRRRRRNVNRLIDQLRELVEIERPVVQRGRQAEAVFDQGFLARTVAAVHAADLRHGHMALIDHQKKIVGKIT